MELPFAVDNDDSNDLQSSANTKNSQSRYHNITCAPKGVSASPHVPSNVLQNEREPPQRTSSRGNRSSSHSCISSSSVVSSSSSSRVTTTNQNYANVNSDTKTNSELLRGGVALYDNVRPHFYSVPSNQLESRASSVLQSKAYQPPHLLAKHDSQDQDNQSSLSIFEDDFVTINTDDETFTDQTISSVDTALYNSYHYSTPATDASTKPPSLSASKTNERSHGHPVDILALLLSTVASQPISSSSPSSRVEEYGRESSKDFMNLCQKASRASKSASKAIREGDIVSAIRSHVESSKYYRDAALQLKRQCAHVYGGKNENVSDTSTSWSGDLKFLAYSLLLLSNSQARSADCLMKSGKGNGMKLEVGKSIQQQQQQRDKDSVALSSGTGSGNDRSVDNGRGTHTENEAATGKEARLRAKIRASLNTAAEADMTDSTFLGKATIGNPPKPIQEEKECRESLEKCSGSPPSTIRESKSAVNPVDDMMELEKELRDMDATLNMGVDLSASTSSIITKKTLEDGSFCVVPGSGASTGGSSYMSSSMMWASGIGGRQASTFHGHGQQPHPHTHTHTQSQQGRARANRVQTILGASAMGMHRSMSIGGNQQVPPNHHANQNPPTSKHHPGLESSWWGQASALASSTTSLSNSMVGIRSANIGVNHPTSNSAAMPANTKQLMRLLDSLKTLGDENASLLREVEDARKARMEAKAARESMRQFKEEYKKRFSTLKAALDKFRSEYPDSKPSSTNSNIVTKSNFVQNNTQLEIQKRDKMIQKLTADLRAERAESKKKDDALRKYENFYKEVKARSEQKKKQKEEELRRKNAPHG